MQCIPKQLSQKQETLSQFFCGFFKSSGNFENFQKNMTLIAWIFPKLRTSKNMVRSVSKRSRFSRSFGNQHGKRAKTLLKFEWQHLYHIC